MNARSLISEYTASAKSEPPTDESASAIQTDCQKYKGLAIGCCNESAIIGLLVSVSTADTIAWEMIEDASSTGLANALKDQPSVVVVAGSPPNGMASVLRMCRRIRRLGYSGKLVVGYWRRRPLRRQEKRLLVASGADYYSHRIWTISRLLMHLDAIHDDSHTDESTGKIAEVSRLLQV